MDIMETHEYIYQVYDAIYNNNQEKALKVLEQCKKEMDSTTFLALLKKLRETPKAII